MLKARRLWPRSLVQPPLTEATRRRLDRQAKVEERRKGQVVVTRLSPEHLEDEQRKAS